MILVFVGVWLPIAAGASATPASESRLLSCRPTPSTVAIAAVEAGQDDRSREYCFSEDAVEPEREEEVGDAPDWMHYEASLPSLIGLGPAPGRVEASWRAHRGPDLTARCALLRC